MPQSDPCFPPIYRLRRSSDYKKVYQRRRSVSDGLIIMYGCENDLPYARIGMSVSRKVGRAVYRNRWKRLIREAFRLARPELPPGIDLIVIPRRETEPSLNRMLDALPRLASKLSRRIGLENGRDVH